MELSISARAAEDRTGALAIFQGYGIEYNGMGHDGDY